MTKSENLPTHVISTNFCEISIPSLLWLWGGWVYQWNNNKTINNNIIRNKQKCQKYKKVWQIIKFYLP